MDSQPAPLPPEAYFEERRVRRKHGNSAAIPSWGWWVIAVALLGVASTAGYLYFGENAIINSLPKATMIACWVLFGLGALVLYFLPTLIARSYAVPRKGAITALNVFLGWAIVGWAAPMFWTELPPVDLHMGWMFAAWTFLGWAGAMVWSIAEVETFHRH